MNIFVLTGAGVSAESGLGTFRDKAGTGIWAKFDPMKLATPEAFAAEPETVHAFCNARRMGWQCTDSQCERARRLRFGTQGRTDPRGSGSYGRAGSRDARADRASGET